MKRVDFFLLAVIVFFSFCSIAAAEDKSLNSLKKDFRKEAQRLIKEIDEAKDIETVNKAYKELQELKSGLSVPETTSNIIVEDSYAAPDAQAYVDFEETGVEALMFMELPTVIGVSKKKETVQDTPMSLYVIENEEMQRWGTRNLFEMLSRTPGVSWYNTGFNGQYGVMVRGLDSIWRYTCTIELAPYGDYGHWVFSPNFFKNAEVARGPAGLMWGSLGEAGLVNLNVRDDIDGFESHVEIGNEGRKSFDLMYGKPFEDEGDHAFIGFHIEEQDSQDVLHTTNYTENPIRITGINPSWFTLVKFKKDNLKFIMMKDYNEWVDDRQNKYSTGYGEYFEGHWGDTTYRMEALVLRGEYHFFEDDDSKDLYLYGELNDKLWYVLARKMSGQRRYAWGFGGNSSHMDGQLELSYGGELFARETNNDPLLNPQTQWNYGNAGTPDWWEDSLPKRYDFNNVYLQAQYFVKDNFSVIAGGRVDNENGAKEDLIFSGPRLGLIYSPKDNMTFKYLYNSADRRPRLNERSDSGVESNAGLENLTSHEFIVFYSWTDKLTTDVTWYFQELQDEIVHPSTYTYRNGGGREARGLEWSLKYRPTDDWLVYWNGGYQDVKVISAIVDGVDVTQDHMSDWRPPFVPEFSSFIGAEYNINDLLKINFDVRTDINIPYFDADGNECEINDATFLDLTLRTKEFFEDRMSFSFVCLNLLDMDEYLPTFGERHGGKRNGVIQPEGRRFYLKTTMKF